MQLAIILFDTNVDLHKHDDFDEKTSARSVLQFTILFKLSTMNDSGLQ